MSKNNLDFKEIEKKWIKYWKEKNIYKWDSSKQGKIYSVDTPPPYISGKMHIGHAFSYSQQDFIVRFMRMRGFNIFYPFGTDDNGLPTERFVEKLNQVRSKDMGRSEFINLSLETLKKITPECIEDFINLAISADYNLYYSTIDKHSQKISQKYFLDLVKKGDAYQKNFPTLWCPECQTSIAQAELEDKEENSLFSTIKFECEGEDLLIATTRPELLGACVAVFVNPNDKRYKSLIGKKAKVPLFNYQVPIIADESADMEKGTGVLMICSYGDKFDVDAIKRHNLEPKIILNEKGELKINEYKGLKIKAARKKILEDLKEKKLIVEQKNINHIVNVHDKCNTPIEFLPTKQWFIKIINRKKEWISQGRKIKWYPDFMRKRYENWVNGLEWDWSISRNRHFGVPIPIWVCEDCNEMILPEDNELPVDPLQVKKNCPKCKKQAKPETMVLDTWATSSLTPQIVMELGDAKNKINLPMSLRPQGHDIIRTWAFYTIVRAYLHEKKIPWNEIIISGNVSLKGEKMSKSKGNVIKPQDVMHQYGSDALRFWASSSKLGSDLDYQEKDLVAGKKMINKLVNASKFVFMNLKEYNKEKPDKLEKIDELFLAKLNLLIRNSTKNFEEYEYSKVKNEVEQFFWSDFCDNYLEIVKKRIYQGKGNKKLSAQYTLYNSLLNILKMIAPIMPFITEEIYQEYLKKNEKYDSIHISNWPETIEKIDFNKIKILNEFYKLLSEIRKEKSKNKKPMNSEIILILDKKTYDNLSELLDDLKNVVNAKEIKQEDEFRVEFV